mmetsp:Transcript_1831/g.2459  ORF Transcript_1831/g.2459 Transcript_1831/m.2459 type:complete len:86 (-) Transcript_1831:326-583(-)
MGHWTHVILFTLGDVPAASTDNVGNLAYTPLSIELDCYDSHGRKDPNCLDPLLFRFWDRQSGTSFLTCGGFLVRRDAYAKGPFKP